MTDVPASFGHWLKQARREMGFTQKELAQLAGCSTTSVRKMEAAAYRPSRQVALRLVESLEVPADEQEQIIRLARTASTAVSLSTLQVDAHQQTGRPRPNNLPAQPTTILGRAAESKSACALLLRDHVRLLTLIGPPGIGKTRLALHVGEELLSGFEDGVFLVMLAPVSDPRLVAPTITRSLGVPEEGEQAALSALLEYLRDKHMLLLLDNFEQVADAASDLAMLLSECPQLKLLVTSREVLHVRGEHQFPVPPLDLPDLQRLPAPNELGSFSSVRLFVERAAAVSHNFTLTQQNAVSVAEICARLDGLPLAIEIAAARTNLFSPQEIAARLSSRLSLLTSGARDLPARQQTLRKAMDWSYNLLSPAEQLLLARLAVFVGGCTLAAIDAVCNPRGDLGIDTAEGVASLLDKSMLQQAEQDGEERRFAMLETVREYAAELLQASGEADLVERWHAQYYLALAEAAEPELVLQNQLLWLNRLEKDHSNIRAVLERHLLPEEESSRAAGGGIGTENRGDTEVALRLSGALWRFWLVHGHLTEGRRWLERAIEQNGSPAGIGGITGASPVVSAYRAKALHGLGGLAYTQGDLPAAQSAFGEAFALWQELENVQAATWSLSNMGLVAVALGEHAAARSYYEEALGIQRELGEKGAIARTLTNLGVLAHDQGDFSAAALLHEESLLLVRKLENKGGVGAGLTNLGLVKLDLGDYDEARGLFEESLDMALELGSQHSAAGALINLSVVAYLQGDHVTELALLRRALPLLQELGDKISIANCIEGFGGAVGIMGDPVKGVRLLAAGATLRKAVSAPLPTRDQARYDESVAAVRAAMSEQAFDKAWSEGLLLSQKEAVAYALSD